MDKRRKYFAKLRAEEIRRKPPTKAQKRNQMYSFVPMDTEVVEGSKSQAEGSKYENRGKLEKLVKAKHGNTRQEEAYERVLWGDLKWSTFCENSESVYLYAAREKVSTHTCNNHKNAQLEAFQNLHHWMRCAYNSETSWTQTRSRSGISAAGIKVNAATYNC
ncbi:hypothetical protein Tco_0309256 [Tanacetum coccineum]